MGPLASLALATLISITAVVVLAYVMRPADDFMVRAGRHLGIPLVGVAAVCGALAVAALGVQSGMILAVGAFMIARIAYPALIWRRRGITRGGILAVFVCVELFAAAVLSVLK